MEIGSEPGPDGHPFDVPGAADSDDVPATGRVSERSPRRVWSGPDSGPGSCRGVRHT